MMIGKLSRKNVKTARKESAEARFRAALVRIIDGCPLNVQKGASITQNNVAREAGVDPSALRASRYPELVAEIQHFAASSKVERGRAGRHSTHLSDERRRSERQRYADMKHQRDHAAALLASADSEVLRLMLRVRDLERHIEELSPEIARPQATLLRVPRR